MKLESLDEEWDMPLSIEEANEYIRAGYFTDDDGYFQVIYDNQVDRDSRVYCSDFKKAIELGASKVNWAGK